MMQVRKHEAGQPVDDRTDWTRLAAMTDADIERAVADDPDAAPILSIEQMKLEYKPARYRIKR